MGKVQWHTSSWHTRTIGLLVLLGFVPVFSFYAGMQYQVLQDSIHAEQDLSAYYAMNGVPQTTGHTTTPDLPISRTFFSTKQTYSFTLFKQQENSICTFVLGDNLGKVVDVAPLLGVAALPCQISNGQLQSGFQKWLDDSTFLVSVKNKTLEVNVTMKTVKVL